LTRDKAWQRANPEQVLEAYINGLVDNEKYLWWMQGAFENGHTTGAGGTSFTAPHVAGMIAAAKELAPALDEYDLTAAALLVADPVESVRRHRTIPSGNPFFAPRQVPAFAKIDYRDNGAGLPHNSYEGGFGYLDKDKYIATVKDLAAMLKDD